MTKERKKLEREFIMSFMPLLEIPETPILNLLNKKRSKMVKSKKVARSSYGRSS